MGIVMIVASDFGARITAPELGEKSVEGSALRGCARVLGCLPVGRHAAYIAHTDGIGVMPRAVGAGP